MENEFQFTFRKDKLNIKNINSGYEEFKNGNFNLNLIDRYAKEDFSNNKNIQLNTEELHLVKCLQLLTQYSIYSIDTLEEQCKFIDELSSQQIKFNEKAQEIIVKQQEKATYYDCRNKDLNENLLNLEFLMKSLDLENKIVELNKPSSLNQFNIIEDEQNNNFKESLQNQKLDNPERNNINHISKREVPTYIVKKTKEDEIEEISGINERSNMLNPTPHAVKQKNSLMLSCDENDKSLNKSQVEEVSYGDFDN